MMKTLAHIGMQVETPAHGHGARKGGTKDAAAKAAFRDALDHGPRGPHRHAHGRSDAVRADRMRETASETLPTTTTTVDQPEAHDAEAKNRHPDLGRPEGRFRMADWFESGKARETQPIRVAAGLEKAAEPNPAVGANTVIAKDEVPSAVAAPSLAVVEGTTPALDVDAVAIQVEADAAPSPVPATAVPAEIVLPEALPHVAPQPEPLETIALPAAEPELAVEAPALPDVAEPSSVEPLELVKTPATPLVVVSQTATLPEKPDQDEPVIEAPQQPVDSEADPEAVTIALLMAATAPPPPRPAASITAETLPKADVPSEPAEDGEPAPATRPEPVRPAGHAVIHALSAQRPAAEPARPAAPAVQAEPAHAGSKDASAEPADTPAPRVVVLERPVPVQPQAMPPLSAPALSVVSAATGDAGWMSHARAPTEVADALPTTASRPVGELKIQLNPVELGTVTARLKLDDGAIAVTIEVQSAEALHRLSSDRDAIERALRAVGLDVRDITIQQAQSSTQQGGTQQNSGADGRGGQPAFAQQQNAGQSGSGAGNGGGGSHEAQRPGMDGGDAGGGTRAGGNDTSRGGVYI